MSGVDKRRDTRTDSGFSLVESVTAVFILALGVLGMTATTTFITGRVSLAEVSTERLVAIQSAMERIRATPSSRLGGTRSRRRWISSRR